MTTYLRISGAFASILILTACAFPAQVVKPTAGAFGADAQNRACPTQTGTRIPVKGTNCSGFGSTYSSADINRTGATTVGEALRLMDPIVTVHN
jgi:hypothetical protein